MKEINTHDAFVKELEHKIPKKTKLADFIAETLCIEKETAYRRLRGDVQFSFHEVALLAKKMNISLDNMLMGVESYPQKQIIMQLAGPPLENTSHSSYTDYASCKSNSSYLNETISFLEEFVENPTSEFGVALSGITFSLFLQYPLLYRFFLMKFVHHACNPQTSTSFEKVREPKASAKANHYLYLLFRKISYTYYIWDRQIIPLLVNDIKYAESIQLIKNEEVLALKKELFLFLDDLEKLAIRGAYKETGKKFELYLSDAHIDVTYAYLSSNKNTVSLLSSFIFYVTASEEKNSFQNVNDWVKSLKRFSTLVSGIGERERIHFFEEQRFIIDTL